MRVADGDPQPGADQRVVQRVQVGRGVTDFRSCDNRDTLGASEVAELASAHVVVWVAAVVELHVQTFGERALEGAQQLLGLNDLALC